MITRKILPVFLFALVIGAGVGLVSGVNSINPDFSQAQHLIVDFSFNLPFQSLYLISILVAIISLSIAVISRPEVLRKRNIIKG